MERDDVDRFRRHIERARANARRTHEDRHPPLGEVLRRFEAGLIEPADSSTRPPQLCVALGLGEQRWCPDSVESAGRLDPSDDATDLIAAAGVLADVAVPWELSAGTTTTVVGPRDVGLALVRAIIVQLAMAADSCVWDLTVETSERAQWEWAGWLAQARHHDGSPAIHPAGDLRVEDRIGGSLDGAVHLLVIDDAHGTAHRRTATGSTAVISIVEGASSPDGDEAILVIGSTGRARWRHELGGEPFAVSGLGEQRATDLAQQLALGADADVGPHRCDHPVDGSPSNHRGPVPNPAAASSVL